jgi:hypothetical protein
VVSSDVGGQQGGKMALPALIVSPPCPATTAAFGRQPAPPAAIKLPAGCCWWHPGCGIHSRHPKHRTPDRVPEQAGKHAAAVSLHSTGIVHQLASESLRSTGIVHQLASESLHSTGTVHQLASEAAGLARETSGHCRCSQASTSCRHLLHRLRDAHSPSLCAPPPPPPPSSVAYPAANK